MRHIHDESHPQPLIKINWKSTAVILTILGFITLISFLYSKTTRMATSTRTVLKPDNASTDSFYYINTVVYLSDFKDSVSQYYLWDRVSTVHVGQNSHYGLFLIKDEQEYIFKLVHLKSPSDTLNKEGKFIHLYNGVVKNWNTVPRARHKSI